MGIKKASGFGQLIRSFRSETPANIDIGCTSLAIYLLFVYYGIWKQTLSFEFPFIPFFEIINLIPQQILCGILITIASISFSLIFLGYKQRLYSFFLGISTLAIILSSKPVYSTNLLFVSSLLILTGLSKGKSWVFRFQISIVYFGAMLNKAFNPDWWNGMYFLNFSSVFNMPIFESIALQTGKMPLAQTFGILTIVIELILSILFISSKTKTQGIFLGLIFHGGMLILTKGDLSLRYFYVMCAAYVLTVDFQTQKSSIYCRRNVLFRVLKKTDFLKNIIWSFHQENNITIEHDTKKYKGFNAILYLLFQHRLIPYMIFLTPILVFIILKLYWYLDPY